MKVRLVQCLLILPSLVLGQRTGDETRASFPEFRELLVRSGLALPNRLSPAAGSREFHLQWDGREMKVIAQQRRAAAARHRRSPQLDGEVMLVTALDRNRQLRFWNIIPDPRVVHVELPQPGGELRGGTVRRESSHFLVVLPDDPSIAEVRFDVPRHDGEQTTLETLASLRLTEDR